METLNSPPMTGLPPKIDPRNISKCLSNSRRPLNFDRLHSFICSKPKMTRRSLRKNMLLDVVAVAHCVP